MKTRISNEWKFARLILPMIGSLALAAFADAPSMSRSPENQVFQFVTTESFTPKAKPGMPTTTAVAYLWIPESCKRVRGVLVLAQNVPEHWLVGHTAIRAACVDNDLAILYACQSS